MENGLCYVDVDVVVVVFGRTIDPISWTRSSSDGHISGVNLVRIKIKLLMLIHDRDPSVTLAVVEGVGSGLQIGRHTSVNIPRLVIKGDKI